MKKIDCYILNRLNAKVAIRKQFKFFEDFRYQELNIREATQNTNYDLCIIGSDEVFNCMSNSIWGFTSQLFGNVRQAKNVITYAASCGATDVSQLPDGVANKIKDAFGRVSGFSVRDLNTKYFVSELVGKESDIHLDPVLVGNFDNEIQNVEMPNNMERPYCVVYSYPNRINKVSEINSIKKFCKTRGLRLVSLGAQQFWIRNHIACTPFQLLKVFANAEFVITDTFHGTIFSAKYAKKFAVIVRESNRNKLQDLINRIGIEKHLIDDINKLDNFYSLEGSVERIEKIEKQERCRSIDYLKKHVN